MGRGRDITVQQTLSNRNTPIIDSITEVQKKHSHHLGGAWLSNSESIFDFINEIKNADTAEDMMYHKVSAFIQNKARDTDTPYSGHFELTPLCNLDCKMCYVHLSSNQIKDNRLLSADEWIRLMQQAIDAGMVTAILSGGECLVYPNFDEVYLYLKSKGINVSVLTNGVLLNHERIQFFQKHRPRKIQVSLYGSSNDAYERVTGRRLYTTVRENIIAAKNAGLPIKISITPSKYMLGDVKHIIKMAKDMDIPYAINTVIMTPRLGTERDKTEHDISLEDYAEIIRYNQTINGRTISPIETIQPIDIKSNDVVNEGLRCGAGRSTFSINWHGIMNPCTQMSSIASNPLRDGFESAWKSNNVEVKSFPRFSDCIKCDYSYACDFCAAENEKLGSRYLLNKKWCKKTSMMISYGLRTPNSQCE